MKEKDLPFDRSKHAIYTANAQNCVQKLLHRYYDDKTSEELWEKIQLKYCEFLEEEPALGKVKLKVSIYDPILIFAWYDIVPDKPDIEDIQQDIYDCFMSAFDKLGKVINVNRKIDNRLMNLAFRKANDIRVEEIKTFPESFRMGYYDYDKENGIVRYSFTRCPNAQFAKRHHLEKLMPVMCNCDHLALRKLHAVLIREGTCLNADQCDYCIMGDKNPLAEKYELIRNEDGLLLSIKKDEQTD